MPTTQAGIAILANSNALRAPKFRYYPSGTNSSRMRFTHHTAPDLLRPLLAESGH